jgi:5-methylcytosine-specific restriction endonuclease McrA
VIGLKNQDGVDTKVCTKCKELKPLTDYQNHKLMKDGKRNDCRTCHNQQTSQWIKDNPEARKAYAQSERCKTGQRNSRYKKLYKITVEEYDQKMLEQKGICAICPKHQSESKKKFAVDHNHKTNQVRGLLCDNCNRALGYFQDNPDLLDSGSVYLRSYSRPIPDT